MVYLLCIFHDRAFSYCISSIRTAVATHAFRSPTRRLCLCDDTMLFELSARFSAAFWAAVLFCCCRRRCRSYDICYCDGALAD